MNMSRIYNRAFKVGVACNIALFTILNIINYVVSYRAYHTRTIRFAPDSGVRWGIPFEWFEGGGLPVGLVLNVFIIAFFSFIFGFAFRFASEKMSER